MQKNYSKTTSHTNTSLKNIQENETVIKETDKGCVKITLKIYYRTKIQEILKDETNYELIDKTDNISKIIK